MRRPLIVAAVLLAFGVPACKPRPSGSALKGTTDTLRPETIAKDRDVPDDGVWMFHFGERRFLEGIYSDRNGDDGKGVITEAEWQKIPSNGTTYPPNRRGLYVSQHPIYNERYAADTLFQSGDAKSSMMALLIRKGCFMPEHMSGNIFDAQSTISFEYQRFRKFMDADPTWVGRGGASGFFQTCTNTYLGQQPAQGYQENGCNQAVKRYYDANDIQLVYDHEWLESGFWLVRDPSCIAQIDSTPGSVVEVLSRTYDLWDPQPFASQKMTQPSQTTPLTPTVATFAILIDALSRASATELTDKALYRLSAMTMPAKTAYANQYKAIFDKAYDCLRDGNWGAFQAVADTFARGMTGASGPQVDGRLKQLIQVMAQQVNGLACSPQDTEVTTAMEQTVAKDLEQWAQKKPKPLPQVDGKLEAARARKARLGQIQQELGRIQQDIANADYKANQEYSTYVEWHNQSNSLVRQYNQLVDAFNAGQYSLESRCDAVQSQLYSARSNRSQHESAWNQWTATAKQLRDRQSQLSNEYNELLRQN